VQIDSLGFQIICFGFIVPVRYHKFVSECKKKRNKLTFLGGYRAHSRRRNEE